MKNKISDKQRLNVVFDVKSAYTETVCVKRFDEKKQAEVEEEVEFFKFQGYAATFGNTDLVGDIIQQGAFTKSIKERMPKLLEQHNPFAFPIGGIKNIFEDTKGLFVDAALPMADKRVSGVIAPQMKAGNIDSMSIGFRVIDFSFNEDTNVRTLTELKLHEISLVTFPANEEALITSVKSEFGIDDVEEVKSKKDFEDLLKSSGVFSRKACTYLASHFKSTQSDSGEENKAVKQSDSADNTDSMDSLLESMNNLTSKMRT